MAAVVLFGFLFTNFEKCASGPIVLLSVCAVLLTKYPLVVTFHFVSVTIRIFSSWMCRLVRIFVPRVKLIKTNFALLVPFSQKTERKCPAFSTNYIILNLTSEASVVKPTLAGWTLLASLLVAFMPK